MRIYTDRQDLQMHLRAFRTDYMALIHSELLRAPTFVCTHCWVHGEDLWHKLTKHRASGQWCQMMNNCLVQAIDSALYFHIDMELAVDRFLDHEDHLGPMSDFVHAYDDVPVGPTPSD